MADVEPEVTANDLLSALISNGRTNLRKTGKRRPSMGAGVGQALHAPKVYLPKQLGPDGEEIESCIKCKRTIQGDVLDVDNRSYHVDCFTCSSCNASIEEGKYLFLENQQVYHETCLNCAVCKQHLKNKAMFSMPNNGQVYCEDHVPGRPKCKECQKVINENCVNMGDKGIFHSACFVCRGCGGVLRGKQFFSEGPHRTCEPCYTKQQKFAAAPCAACGKGIRGSYLSLKTATGATNKLHSDCYCCDTCKTPLSGKKSGQINAKLYCAQHFADAKTVRASQQEQAKKGVRL